jgi:hypothetical protein
MGCGELVDQVEEMPEDFESSSPVHRACALAMIEMMRADCPICSGGHN